MRVEVGMRLGKYCHVDRLCDGCTEYVLVHELVYLIILVPLFFNIFQ
jgi:hypothetical protein